MRVTFFRLPTNQSFFQLLQSCNPNASCYINHKQKEKVIQNCGKPSEKSNTSKILPISSIGKDKILSKRRRASNPHRFYSVFMTKKNIPAHLKYKTYLVPKNNVKEAGSKSAWSTQRKPHLATKKRSENSSSEIKDSELLGKKQKMCVDTQDLSPVIIPNRHSKELVTCTNDTQVSSLSSLHRSLSSHISTVLPEDSQRPSMSSTLYDMQSPPDSPPLCDTQPSLITVARPCTQSSRLSEFLPQATKPASVSSALRDLQSSPDSLPLCNNHSLPGITDVTHDTQSSSLLPVSVSQSVSPILCDTQSSSSSRIIRHDKKQLPVSSSVRPNSQSSSLSPVLNDVRTVKPLQINVCNNQHSQAVSDATTTTKSCSISKVSNTVTIESYISPSQLNPDSMTSSQEFGVPISDFEPTTCVPGPSYMQLLKKTDTKAVGDFDHNPKESVISSLRTAGKEIECGPANRNPVLRSCLSQDKAQGNRQNLFSCFENLVKSEVTLVQPTCEKSSTELPFVYQHRQDEIQDQSISNIMYESRIHDVKPLISKLHSLSNSEDDKASSSVNSRHLTSLAIPSESLTIPLENEPRPASCSSLPPIQQLPVDSGQQLVNIKTEPSVHPTWILPSGDCLSPALTSRGSESSF